MLPECCPDNSVMLSGCYWNRCPDASGICILDSIEDSKGKLTNYVYDNLNRITSVSKNVGGIAATTSYSYENDRIKAITHNFSYNYAYDSLDNSTTVSV